MTMTLPTRAGVAIGLGVVAAAIVGCESLAPPAPSATASAQAGAPLSGDGFSTIVPPDWTNRINDRASVNPLKSGGVPLLVIERSPYTPTTPAAAAVSPSIAVVRLRDRIPDDRVLGYLKNVPNSTLQGPPQHYALGRDEGVYVVYTRSDAPGVVTLDMIVTHHTSSLEVFLNAAGRDFQAAVADVTAIADTWVWTDGP